MRLWKLTDDGLSYFEKDSVPDWVLNMEGIPEDRLVQAMQDHPDKVLARYEVPLDGGAKTFVFAIAPPGRGIIRQIQQLEHSRRGAV